MEFWDQGISVTHFFCNGLRFIDIFYYNSYFYNHIEVIDLLTKLIIVISVVN